MKPWTHKADRLIFYFLALFCLAVSTFQPLNNWDMIGYIAAAKSIEEPDPQKIHSFTYEQIQAAVSPLEFKEMTLSSQYKKNIHQLPAALNEQLPFYQIRPLYVYSVFVLYKGGVNIAFATHLLSGIAVFIALLLITRLSAEFIPKPFRFVIPAVALIAGIIELARLSSPDALAFLVITVTIYCYLKKRTATLLLTLPISIAIRTDLLLYVIPFCIALFMLDRKTRKYCAVSLLTALGVYVAISLHWEAYGWSKTFYHTFVGAFTFPQQSTAPMSITIYGKKLAEGIAYLALNKAFIVYVVISAYFIAAVTMDCKKEASLAPLISPISVVAWIGLAYIALHFILFPAAWDRYFVAPYLFGAFAYLHRISIPQKI